MSVVYFIADDHGAVKIGVTRSIKSRISSLQTSQSGNLKILGVIDGTRETESKFHRKWEHLRLNREWFTLNDEISAYIEKYARAPTIETDTKKRRIVRSAEDRARFRAEASIRMFNFLRFRYPEKLNERVSDDLGISLETVKKWRDRQGLPDVPTFMQMATIYGSAFLDVFSVKNIADL